MFRIIFGLIACIVLVGCSTTLKLTENITSLNLTEHRRYVGGMPYKLQGGSPSGGIYSGPGVKDGILYPREAGPGKHTITYTVCEKSAFDTFEIFGRIPSDGEAGVCPSCNGTRKCKRCNGDKNFYENAICPNPKCENGRIERMWGLFSTECGQCKGTATIQVPCNECNGNGDCQNCR